MRKLSIKYLVFSILGIVIFAYYILHPTSYIPPALATTQPCPAQSPNPRVIAGLISTRAISDNFSNPTGTCVVDTDRAAFLSIEIPTYESLKSDYFDKSKFPPTQKITLTGDQTQTNLTTPINLSTANTDKVYHISGDLTITSNITVNSTGVVFVEGNLDITTNLTHTSKKAGLVFVVKGNVIIAPSVTRIDAVLISSGTIFTAGDGCTKNSVETSDIDYLVINGSLISLKQPPITNPNVSYIKFCRKRTRSNNAQAAEQIIQQSKYLVILKDIVADTLQTWSEIP